MVFSNSLSRCVLFLFTLISNLTSILKQASYYILVINLSVSICYLEYPHKPNNKTFPSLRLGIRCVYVSVLTTNTHTYQSFSLLKSSAKNRVNCLRCFWRSAHYTWLLRLVKIKFKTIYIYFLTCILQLDVTALL